MKMTMNKRYTPKVCLAQSKNQILIGRRGTSTLRLSSEEQNTDDDGVKANTELQKTQ